MLHNCFADAFLGIIWGVYLALWWTMGNVTQVIEFWNGSCPRWIYLIFGPPTISLDLLKSSVRLKRFSVKIAKPMVLYSFLILTLVLIEGSIKGTYSLLIAITFPTTWILCVGLSELYFRRKKYNRVKDWSKIPLK